jgi:predicted transcriptional regulator
MDKSMSNLKLELVQWLMNIEDSRTFDKIMAIKKAENNDWWSGISQQEIASIEAGIADANEGKLMDLQEVIKRYKKWL